MQRLSDLLKQSPRLSETERWNTCREYLQLIILRAIFQSPMGPALVFQGGTCLRICHHLKRYSEDLDFSRIGQGTGYSFRKLHSMVLQDLARRGFEVSGTYAEDKVVQKAWVRVGDLPGRLDFSLPSNQKLSIRIEIDLRPPWQGGRETYFVSRLGELFPIVKYDVPTLFAGKALAVLFRPYERARDLY
ncbi:MAG: nucleotidyl transferase AbiEii/AbiGii toxin family protein, partial [Elusimicrobia bacterium]|nr:nucleotidyl transferase AbiEii/AbiGii toxin family protein [Elusimicrobiota bacterium]